MASKRLLGAIAITLVLLMPTDAFSVGSKCPAALERAAEAFRQRLEDDQARVRASTPDQPAGVEETVQFDLLAHACHRGPGQAYRVYQPGVCLAPTTDARVAVRYAYELFFRKALTAEELFRKEWEPGHEGVLQVEFEREGADWVPVGRQEVLVAQ